MEYKPGLITASLSQGKTKLSASNSLLDQLLSGKSKLTEKATNKKANKKKKKISKKTSEPTENGGNLNGVSAGVKRKNEEPTETKTKKAKKDLNSVSINQEPTETKIKTKKAKKGLNSVSINQEPTETKIKTKKAKKGLNSVSINQEPTETKIKTKKAKKDLNSVSINQEPTTTTAKPKKTKKDLNSTSQLKDVSNAFPFVHESLLQQKSGPQQKTKKAKKKTKQDDMDDDELSASARKRKRRNKTADKRTIFIGNCPLSSDKKVMTKLFKDFGAIESIRFRCGPAAKLDLPRRAIIIKKEFHEKASSYVCYVVFKEEGSAEKAIQMNGHVLDGHHLRLDLAANHKKHDKKRSVFVGNLPFAVSEEELRSHFLDCGDINNVRVVRDRQTSIGKGIAYIEFESKDGVTLAKRLNEKEFQGRKLRVLTCTNKPEKVYDKFMNNKNNKNNKTLISKPAARPDKKKMSFAPSNRNSAKSFNEILQSKKESRLKKSKKKKQGVQKSDGLSSIFGDMTADVKRLKMENPKLRDKKPKDPMKKKMDKKRDKKMDKKRDKKMDKKTDKKSKKIKMR